MTAQILVADPAAAGGRVRVLTLSHPARKNALDAAALDRLVHELSRAAAESVRALVLAGEGGVFSAGSDLSAVGAAADGLHANLNDSHGKQIDLHAKDRPRVQDELPDAPLGRACQALESAPFPIVAAVDGPAYGAGAELACACDLRVASASARFSLPPARLGLVYSIEGCARVVRLLGLAQARRLFFTAAAVDAGEAHRIGLCDELAPEPSALPRAVALAGEMARLSPRSLAGMKQIFSSMAASIDPAARAQLEWLRREAFRSEDAREGLAAFLERRPPRFPDR